VLQGAKEILIHSACLFITRSFLGSLYRRRGGEEGGCKQAEAGELRCERRVVASEREETAGREAEAGGRGEV
jgi:hypothetical protein